MKRACGILLMAVGLLIAVGGCGKVPEGVLDKERMARLMADIHVGESVIEMNTGSFPTDSSKRAFRQAIYERNGVTPAEVDTSLRWYGYHMEEYLEVYDRIIEILDKNLASVQEIGGSTAAALAAGGSMAVEGDSVDVWFDTRYRPFAANLSSDRLPFSFRTDSNWENGDRYRFRTKLTGNSRSVTLVIAVEYNSGEIETFSSRLTGEGWHEASFALDSALVAREIYGELRYDAALGETAFADSIMFVRMRYSPVNAALRQAVKRLSPKQHSAAFD